MILLIDNYDSFSYNLVQLIGAICQEKRNGEPVQVIRNDQMTVEEIRSLSPSAIILSPGPGRPSQAGVCEETIRKLGGTVPILGVCLGHQSICEALGGKITYAKTLMHGKQSIARLDLSHRLFSGLPEKIPVARYHSLAADRASLPEELLVTAETEDGQVMAVAHKSKPIYGLQFHPESVLTPDGRQIMENFLS